MAKLIVPTPIALQASPQRPRVAAFYRSIRGRRYRRPTNRARRVRLRVTTQCTSSDSDWPAGLIARARARTPPLALKMVQVIAPNLGQARGRRVAPDPQPTTTQRPSGAGGVHNLHHSTEPSPVLALTQPWLEAARHSTATGRWYRLATNRARHARSREAGQRNAGHSTWLPTTA